MKTEEILLSVSRYWWMVLCGVVVALVIASAVVLVTPPKYAATARLYVSTPTAATVQDLSQGNSFGQQVIKTYAQIALTPYVLDPVIRRLNLDQSASTLASSLSVNALLDTQILTIEATGTSPAETGRTADAIASQLATAVEALNSNRDGAAVGVTQLQSARTDTVVIAPLPGRSVPLAALIGLAIGLLAAVARGLLDTRLRSASDLELAVSKPILGVVNFEPAFRDDPLLVHSRTAKAVRVVESFKAMRTNLQFVAISSDCKQFVITSSVPGEGKTTSVANLAIAIAFARRRVLLIDADLRRPRVAEMFGIDGSVGLSDVLGGSSKLDSAVQVWGANELHILPSGAIPPNPSELLQSDRMRDLMASFKGRYDYVLVDSPPLLVVADAAILAKITDGAVVVAGIGIARRHQLRASLATLANISASVLGILVTHEKVHMRGSHYYGYTHQSGEIDGSTNLVSSESPQSPDSGGDIKPKLAY